MKKACVSIAFLLLVGTAYSNDPSPETPFRPDMVRRPVLGIQIENVDGQIRVTSVREEWGAAISGIRKGDVILSINGHPVRERLDVIRLIDDISQEDKAAIVILREGKERKYKVGLINQDFRRDLDAVQRILFQEKTVNLAITIGTVTNTTVTDKLMLEQWLNGTRSYLLAHQEQLYLASFNNQKNFHLADRARLDQLLNEFNFSQTGYVSDQMRAQMGKMLGATHILNVESSRFGNVDYVQFRLIHVESGEVIVSFSSNQPLQ